MNKEFKKRWIKALRSGEYKQGRRVLNSVDDDKYCCLGVACELLVKDKFLTKTRPPGGGPNSAYVLSVKPDEAEFSRQNTLYLEKAICDKIEFEENDSLKLAELNDLSYLSFEEIAKYIEEKL